MPGQPDPPTFEERFRETWKAVGLRPAEIDGKWEEFWWIEGERDRLEKARPHAMSEADWKIEVDKGVAAYTSRIVRARKWGR